MEQLRTRTCPECRGTMVAGSLPDKAYGETGSVVWVEGPVEASFWTNRLANKVRYHVDAYRCQSCGLVRLSADRPMG